MADERQWCRILEQSPIEIETLLTNLVSKPVKMSIESDHLWWAHCRLPFECLGRATLEALRTLVALQHQRQTLFTETLTPVYTIRYERCTLNVLLEQSFDRRAVLNVCAKRHPTAFTETLRRLEGDPSMRKPLAQLRGS